MFYFQVYSRIIKKTLPLLKFHCQYICFSYMKLLEFVKLNSILSFNITS